MILSNGKTYHTVWSFYRENPHRFAKDYLHLNIHLFQKIMLVMMNCVRKQSGGVAVPIKQTVGRMTRLRHKEDK